MQACVCSRPRQTAPSAGSTTTWTQARGSSLPGLLLVSHLGAYTAAHRSVHCKRGHSHHACLVQTQPSTQPELCATQLLPCDILSLATVPPFLHMLHHHKAAMRHTVASRLVRACRRGARTRGRGGRSGGWRAAASRPPSATPRAPPAGCPLATAARTALASTSPQCAALCRLLNLSPCRLQCMQKGAGAQATCTWRKQGCSDAKAMFIRSLRVSTSLISYIGKPHCEGGCGLARTPVCS